MPFLIFYPTPIPTYISTDVIFSSPWVTRKKILHTTTGRKPTLDPLYYWGMLLWNKVSWRNAKLSLFIYVPSFLRCLLGLDRSMNVSLPKILNSCLPQFFLMSSVQCFGRQELRSHSRLRQFLIEFQVPETKLTLDWLVGSKDSKNVLHEILANGVEGPR